MTINPNLSAHKLNRGEQFLLYFERKNKILLRDARMNCISAASLYTLNIYVT